MGWMTRGLAAAAAMVLMLSCGGNGDDDAGPGGDEDNGGGGSATEISLPGLDGEVEVLVDSRGMPHIYGTTLHDVFMVQGYLMARDRFAQMELSRRGVNGTLAATLGNVDAGQVNADRGARQLGLRRIGEAIYDSLPSDDPSRLGVEAYVEGVNHWVETVAMADDYEPARGVEVLRLILGSPNYEPWTPAEVFANGRALAYNLAFGSDDITRSTALAAIRAAFPADSEDDAIAARAGFFGDAYSARQARLAYTRDGFPNIETDTGSRSLFPGEEIRPERGPLNIAEPPAFDPETLAAAEAFVQRIREIPGLYSDDWYGSNNWVVSGDLTESGNPILANDPHLALNSPPIWWYAHLNTAEMGGEDDLDVQGVSLALGTPGILLGYNQNLAWGATVHPTDTIDYYNEVVTFRNVAGDGEDPVWEPASVLFNGEQVEVTLVPETIVVAGAEDQVLNTFLVPHHGPIVSQTVETIDGDSATGTAISYRFTGEEATNDFEYFFEAAKSSTVQEAFDALEAFTVGNQNWVFVDSEGTIGWSTQVRIPIRDYDCSFNLAEDGTVQGIAPSFVVPGTGDFEWSDENLSDRYLPHDIDPARGWIATANQDSVGYTADGNPCNGVDPDDPADDFYLNHNAALGWRQGRIVERLDAMALRGNITVEDMMDLQGETESSFGNVMRDPIVDALDLALGGLSDDEVLNDLVGSLTVDQTAAIQDVADRLRDWSFATPTAHDNPDSEEIADSVATTLFNVLVGQLIVLALSDEADAAVQPGSALAGRLLEWMTMDATFQEENIFTFRQDYLGVEGYADSVLWDDLGTADVVETRAERITRAAMMTVEYLTAQLGAEPTGWTWGLAHTIRFEQQTPAITGPAVISVPEVGEEPWPNGFPRPGDYGAPDVLNFGLWSFGDQALALHERFGARGRTQSGPSMRVVVEMTSDGPVAYNSLPGGQVMDPDDPNHRDEAMLWWNNEQPRLWFSREDVEANTVERIQFSSTTN